MYWKPTREQSPASPNRTRPRYLWLCVCVSLKFFMACWCVQSSRSSSRKGSSKKSGTYVCFRCVWISVVSLSGAARESSSRLSSLTQSESPVTSATPDSSIPALDHPTQQLVPTPTSASSLETAPQQPLPLASHVPLPGRNLPPQTPFPVVPRGAVQWGQFTTPAQTASDKDSTGLACIPAVRDTAISVVDRPCNELMSDFCPLSRYIQSG